MQFAAGCPDLFRQPPFDGEMDIFVRKVKAKPSIGDFPGDVVESRRNFLGFGRRNQTDLREHPRMGDRTLNIVAKEPAVERQRGGEGLDFGQSRNLEAPANEIFRWTVADDRRRDGRRFGLRAPLYFEPPAHRGSREGATTTAIPAPGTIDPAPALNAR